MGKPLIRFENVEVGYGTNVVLSNISFVWNAEHFVYLLGKVGAGKSTLLKSIYRGVNLSLGNGTVLDYSLETLPEKEIPFLRRKLGIIQSGCLLEDATVYANLSLCLEAVGITKDKEVKSRIGELLEKIGLTALSDKYLFELSEGEKLKVATARALINSPSILLIDEPTKDFDVETIKTFMQILKEYSMQHDALVVMATHNLQLVRAYPGLVYLLNDGLMKEVTHQFYLKSK